MDNECTKTAEVRRLNSNFLHLKTAGRPLEECLTSLVTTVFFADEVRSPGCISLIGIIDLEPASALIPATASYLVLKTNSSMPGHGATGYFLL